MKNIEFSERASQNWIAKLGERKTEREKSQRVYLFIVLFVFLVRTHIFWGFKEEGFLGFHVVLQTILSPMVSLSTWFRYFTSRLDYSLSIGMKVLLSFYLLALILYFSHFPDFFCFSISKLTSFNQHWCYNGLGHKFISICIFIMEFVICFDLRCWLSIVVIYVCRLSIIYFSPHFLG